jgi:hypothetical protein
MKDDNILRAKDHNWRPKARALMEIGEEFVVAEWRHPFDWSDANALAQELDYWFREHPEKGYAIFKPKAKATK